MYNRVKFIITPASDKELVHMFAAAVDRAKRNHSFRDTDWSQMAVVVVDGEGGAS